MSFVSSSPKSALSSVFQWACSRASPFEYESSADTLLSAVVSTTTVAPSPGSPCHFRMPKTRTSTLQKIHTRYLNLWPTTTLHHLMVDISL